jgi:hypothetical protein
MVGGIWLRVPLAAECGAEGAKPDLMRVCVREKLEHLRLYPQQKAQLSATKQGKRSGGGVL